MGPLFSVGKNDTLIFLKISLVTGLIMVDVGNIVQGYSSGEKTYKHRLDVLLPC